MKIGGGNENECSPKALFYSSSKQSSKGISASVEGRICQIYCAALVDISENYFKWAKR